MHLISPFKILQTFHLSVLQTSKNSSKVQSLLHLPTPLLQFRLFPSIRVKKLKIYQITGISFDLSDKELFCVEEQDVFDRIYSLVKCFGDLSSGSKVNLVESLRSNFSVLLPNIDSLFRVPSSPNGDGNGCSDGGGTVLDRVNSHRNAFKIYTFFLVHIVISQESTSASTNTTKVHFYPSHTNSSLCYCLGLFAVCLILISRTCI